MSGQHQAEDWPEVPVGAPSEPVPVPSPRTVEQVRTRWRLDRQRNRRRVSQALDDVCVRLYGVEAAARYGIRDRRRGGR